MDRYTFSDSFVFAHLLSLAFGTCIPCIIVAATLLTSSNSTRLHAFRPTASQIPFL
jgi:hypothetical protein